MKVTIRSAMYAGVCASVALLVGCASTCKECGGGECDGSCEAPEASALTPAVHTVNTTCPFSGGTVKAGVKTVSFKGNDVGFCCDGCVSKFEGMSDDKKAEIMAKAK